MEAYDAFGNVAESEYPEITVPTDDASFINRVESGNVETAADPDASEDR